MAGTRGNENLGEARENTIENTTSSLIASDLPKTSADESMSATSHGPIPSRVPRRRRMSKTHGMDTPGYAVNEDGAIRAQMRQKSAARQAAAAKRMRDAHGRFISRESK